MFEKVDHKTIIMGVKERGGRIETQISSRSFSRTSKGAEPSGPTNWRPTVYSRVTGIFTARSTSRALGLDRSSNRDALFDEPDQIILASVQGVYRGNAYSRQSDTPRSIPLEFSFRSNFRQMRNAKFDLLVAAL